MTLKRWRGSRGVFPVDGAGCLVGGNPGPERDEGPEEERPDGDEGELEEAHGAAKREGG